MVKKLLDFQSERARLVQHLRRDADCVAGNGGPPHHQVGEGRDPQDAAQEGDGEKLLG